MYYDPFLTTLLICLLLLVLGLLITIHLVEYGHKSKSSPDREYEPYVNEEGFHSYYERSLIEKSLFHKLHPKIPISTLRTFRRLFSR